MKKFSTAILCLCIVFTSSVCVFADTESLLISVKDKITIPEELTEFSTSTVSNGERVTHSFLWENEDGSSTLNIKTNNNGNIISYNRYSDSYFNSENYDTLKIDKNFKIDDIVSVSDKLIHSLVPEFFANKTDCLVRIPYDDAYKLSSSASYTIKYERQYNGIAVADNGARVTVTKTSEGYIPLRADISLDYSRDFAAVPTADTVMETKEAEKYIDSTSPLKLIYKKSHDNSYTLEYVREDELYIDAADGKQATKVCTDDEYLFYSDEKADNSVESSGGGNSLSPAERAELESISELISVDELFDKMLSLKELGINKDIDKTSLRSNTFKSDNGYYTFLYIDEELNDDTYSSIDAYFDAQSGEMLSFHRYARNYDDNGNNESKAYDFISKYYPDKLSECNTVSENGQYTRLVNNILYPQNSITAFYNNKTQRIDDFDLVWDKNISEMPKPDGIISAVDASGAVFEAYPVSLYYIVSDTSDNKYTLCYTQNEYNIRVNAFDKSIITSPTKKDTSHYSDVSNHWVEEIADTLCDYGIKTEGSLLNPNSEITQKEFLTLIYSGVLGYDNFSDNETVERILLRRKVISSEEALSINFVTRENAIRYLLRATGIKEVAEIDGIYICDFKDNNEISRDKLGYCAIAKGMGLVNGADNMLRPADNITYAEALTLIYNYLTRL